ncbi:MAG TPA: transglutaminase family protein [Verrucomicrobiae bacterium]|nr:transglutaminase family protein [Verrucomicrobiae bacterium]
MTYDINHTTAYEYSGEVSVSHHVLRLNPRTLEHQECEQHELEIEPAPAAIKTHLDYYGNKVAFITLERPHRRLVIKSLSQVETKRIPGPAPAETPAWETVRDSCRGEQIGTALEASEFIFDSPLIKASERFGDYAIGSFSRGQPILAGVIDLTQRIHRDFKFDPAATTIATPLEEVFRARRGVCQDFAQLQIACLRSLGLPARYVSGYLETDPPPGQPRLAGADASHAWVSFYCHGIGWIDTDPTNGILPSTRHITVAWGRDYSDVSPVRGVVLGGGDHSLSVAVDVIPVG